MNEINSPLKIFKDLMQNVFGNLIVSIRFDKIEETETEIKVEITTKGKQTVFSTKKSLIEDIYSSFNSMQIEGDTILYDDLTYETLVEMERPYFLGLRTGEGTIQKEDKDNGLKYEISQPTDKYLIFLLTQIGKTDLRRRRPRLLMPVYQLDELMKIDDLFKLIKRIFKFYTLKITSNSSRKLSQYIDITNSFLFTLSYNLDTSIVEMRLIDEFMRWNRLSPVRRANIEDIDPPRRRYISDLVHHYQMGVSTDNPLLQFISFYHVLEYFFEDIYSQDLVDNIKDRITNPSFSYKRPKDLKELIKFIEAKKKQRGDDFSYNELEALELTLKKYINLENIKATIEEYDATLIDYYKDNLVTFSKGASVDLTSGSSEQNFKNLAGRIYNTRNAIVHSKEGNKPRYIPFKHDKELMKEVPFIRFIAENIIINSSQSIEI